MQLYELGDIVEAKAFLKRLGVESGGIGIMTKKMQLHYIYIKSLKTPAANILKQDALSIGAELAVPGGVITCDKPEVNCLLIATTKHLEVLSRKELAQPFGLKEVAKGLKSFLKSKRYPIRIMGVLNANNDSFYDASRFDAKSAQSRIETMIEEGADIIDIGAVSSRPGAPEVSVDEELSRIEPILKLIGQERLYERCTFSVDTTVAEVGKLALKNGFEIINDISGGSSEELLELVAQTSCEYVLMHMQGTPQTMQKNPHYDDVMTEVERFFETKLAYCEEKGIKRSQIILDLGIGFGKTLCHNITLLQNLRHFRRFGCELLVGASRKSMIDKIYPAKPSERLPGTLAIHLKALDEGASILRVHDVKEHKQAVEVYRALRQRG